jgi:hypothetical protein
MADSQDTTPRPSEGGPSVRYLGLRASRSGIGASEEERSILSMPRMVPDERAFEGRATGENLDRVVVQPPKVGPCD